MEKGFATPFTVKEWSVSSVKKGVANPFSSFHQNPQILIRSIISNQDFSSKSIFIRVDSRRFAVEKIPSLLPCHHLWNFWAWRLETTATVSVCGLALR